MKNKKRCRLIALLMAWAFLAFCLPSAAFAQQSDVATIEKIYVSKACYQPGETAHVEFLVNNPGNAMQGSAEVKISHLENVIWTTTVPVSLEAEASASFSFDWQTPAEDFKGYLVQITLCANTYVSAIDVSSDVSRYNLDFIYSAAVDGTPQRQIYIDGYGFGEIQFPPNGSWDEWTSSRKTVHLRRGIHRMVIQAEGTTPGYINLDRVDISTAG
ncbi:MAG TPA: carbohydrate-binding protein [Candidatus Fournierella excrementavium]|nr:carbohydrate-binding protein [Candidatus Fournierella excrementavium]